MGNFIYIIYLFMFSGFSVCHYYSSCLKLPLVSVSFSLSSILLLPCNKWIQHTSERSFLDLYTSSFKGVVQMSFKNPDLCRMIFSSFEFCGWFLILLQETSFQNFRTLILNWLLRYCDWCILSSYHVKTVRDLNECFMAIIKKKETSETICKGTFILESSFMVYPQCFQEFRS